MGSTRSIVGRLCLVAAFCCTASAPYASTTLYKWVDADGVTHYSDRPEPGAQKVKIAAAQTYKGGSPQPADTRAQPSRAVVATSYARLTITAPEDGAVLSNVGGHVDVSAALEPDLAEGHQLWLVLDGKLQPAPGGSASFDASRGLHTLVASVTDAAGNELITSAPVTFTVRQTSIAQPPQGSTIPKPKPKG